METTINAAQLNNRWIAFKENADLSDLDDSKISAWQFTGKEASTGSLIRASDGVTDFGLTRDAKGFPDAAAYAVAYDVSFAKEHLESVTGLGVSLTNPTRAEIETLPPAILREYVYRTDTSRPVTTADLASLRKPKDAAAEAEEKKG